MKYTNTVTDKKRNPGRPRRIAKQVSLERVECRVTAAEKRAWKAKAQNAGKTLSVWLIDLANGAPC